VTPLDLKQNVVLERFELSAKETNLPLAHGWIYKTLQSITSPVFNKLVFWILGSEYPVAPDPINGDGWKSVDALLVSLANRNPGLSILFMGSVHGSVIVRYLPLTRSMGLFKFGPRVENRFRRFGLPY